MSIIVRYPLRALLVLLLAGCAGGPSTQAPPPPEPPGIDRVPYATGELAGIEQARILRAFLESHPARSDRARHVERLRQFHERGLQTPRSDAAVRAEHARELARLARLLERPIDEWARLLQAAALLEPGDERLAELRWEAADAALRAGRLDRAADLLLLAEEEAFLPEPPRARSLSEQLAAARGARRGQ